MPRGQDIKLVLPRYDVLQKRHATRIGVPSRGSCFLKKTRTSKSCGVRVGLGKAVVFGSAFLARAVVFEEKHAQTEAMSLGSAFLAGAFVFRENHVQRKRYVSRVAVPSRGSCFPKKKACPGKGDPSRIGVPSRGFCFLRKTCPEKNHVSRVAVP